MKPRVKNSKITGKMSPSTTRWSLAEKIIGFGELGRPAEWSKPLMNMTLAAFIAFYIYNSVVDPILFIQGFFSVAFLWSGLYALNDFTDWKIDAIHEVKKDRPIPSGKVSPKQGLFFSVVLIILSFSIAFVIDNFMLILCLGFMMLNQFLYTMKPYRFKSRKGLDMISGSMINPIFRYLSGLVLFVSFYRLTSNPFPILPILFVAGLQFSGYSLYRSFSTHHDKKVKMQSTVALLSEEKVKAMSYSAMAVGAFAYILLLVNGATIQEQWLGYIPPQYAFAIIGVILLVPLLKDSILNPSKADMRKSYTITYIMTFAFIILNWLIFIFFR
jgi:4-hydroxybenzoate polyprenyltransferase